MSVTLAATQHDPDGRLYDQTRRILPILAHIFTELAIQVTHTTQKRSIELLVASGARVQQETAEHAIGMAQLGRPRRAALELALQSDASFLLLCDFDRALHWAEYYSHELAQVVGRIQEYNFTVLGRTERAFASHPRVQRDTEAIINHVYETISEHAWDVTAAARGLSRDTAEAILRGCPDESVGTDVSWPLFLAQSGNLSLGYITTEGLEFETADRYADQIVRAGGVAQWIARIDADPQRWVERLELARVEVEATLPYIQRKA